MHELAFDTLPVLTDWERTHPSQAIERRRLDTVQPCAFCGQQALFVFIAHTLEPQRWMDVCGQHAQYLHNPSYTTLDGKP